MRRLFAICILLLFSVNLFAEKGKPNIIVIYADDLGYGDISVQGAIKVQTPAIDKLASEGRRFTDYHSASAVCSPSRYSLLTGRYPARKDFYNPIFMDAPLHIDEDRVTIANVMKSAGYKTGIVGKWHLGFGNEKPVDWNKPLKPGPLELGFDYYYGVPVVNSHPPFVYVENHHVVGYVDEDPFKRGKRARTRYFDEKMDINLLGGAKHAHELYKDREVGTNLKNKACDFIRENKDNPFFLYFATTNIHHPFTPAPQFIGSSEAGAYGDFIHELDWIVSELMITLEQEGIADNTLVVFTSDNGPMLNRGGQTAREAGHMSNGNLLGFKFDAWEGGHRVPCIIRWNNHIPAGTVSDDLMSSVDMFATLAAVVGYNPQKEEGPDSMNQLKTWLGTSKKPIRNQLVISPSNPKNIAFRKGDWMYISNKGGGGFADKHLGDHTFGGAAALPFTGQINSDISNGKTIPNAPEAQLYNLKDDPYEATNVYNEFPKVVETMRNELKTILAEEK